MIYELRVYRVVQGRMADLLTRFEHQTVPIMVRHGFLQAGFWNSGLRLSQTLNGWPSVNRQRRTAL